MEMSAPVPSYAYLILVVVAVVLFILFIVRLIIARKRREIVTYPNPLSNLAAGKDDQELFQKRPRERSHGPGPRVRRNEEEL
jgi:hypothetical protein